MSAKLTVKRSPRAMPVETVVTRYKLAQKNKQVKNERLKVKLPQKSVKKYIRKPKKTSKDLQKCNNFNNISGEFYPNTVKRNIDHKKVVLKPKHCMQMIGGIKSCNKRKLHIPRKEVKRIRHNSDTSTLNSETMSPQLKEMSRDMSINDLVLMIEEDGGLDEEDLLEILTCPSPVWWEDPPTGYIEDPIFARQKPAEQKSIKIQLLEERIKEEERRKRPEIESPNAKDVEDVDITGFHVNIKNRGVKFMNKRCKLESLLGDIRNKVKKDNNSSQMTKDRNNEDNNVSLDVKKTKERVKNVIGHANKNRRIKSTKIKRNSAEEKRQSVDNISNEIPNTKFDLKNVEKSVTAEIHLRQLDYDDSDSNENNVFESKMVSDNVKSDCANLKLKSYQGCVKISTEQLDEIHTSKQLEKNEESIKLSSENVDNANKADNNRNKELVSKLNTNIISKIDITQSNSKKLRKRNKTKNKRNNKNPEKKLKLSSTEIKDDARFKVIHNKNVVKHHNSVKSINEHKNCDNMNNVQNLELTNRKNRSSDTLDDNTLELEDHEIFSIENMEIPVAPSGVTKPFTIDEASDISNEILNEPIASEIPTQVNKNVKNNSRTQLIALKATKPIIIDDNVSSDIMKESKVLTNPEIVEEGNEHLVKIDIASKKIKNFPFIRIKQMETFIDKTIDNSSGPTDFCIKKCSASENVSLKHTDDVQINDIQCVAIVERSNKNDNVILSNDESVEPELPNPVSENIDVHVTKPISNDIVVQPIASDVLIKVNKNPNNSSEAKLDASKSLKRNKSSEETLRIDEATSDEFKKSVDLTRKIVHKNNRVFVKIDKSSKEIKSFPFIRIKTIEALNNDTINVLGETSSGSSLINPSTNKNDSLIAKSTPHGKIIETPSMTTVGESNTSEILSNSDSAESRTSNSIKSKVIKYKLSEILDKNGIDIVFLDKGSELKMVSINKCLNASNVPCKIVDALQIKSPAKDFKSAQLSDNDHQKCNIQEIHDIIREEVVTDNVRRLSTDSAVSEKDMSVEYLDMSLLDEDEKNELEKDEQSQQSVGICENVSFKSDLDMTDSNVYDRIHNSHNNVEYVQDNHTDSIDTSNKRIDTNKEEYGKECMMSANCSSPSPVNRDIATADDTIKVLEENQSEYIAVYKIINSDSESECSFVHNNDVKNDRMTSTEANEAKNTTLNDNNEKYLKGNDEMVDTELYEEEYLTEFDDIDGMGSECNEEDASNVDEVNSTNFNVSQNDMENIIEQESPKLNAVEDSDINVTSVEMKTNLVYVRKHKTEVLTKSNNQLETSLNKDNSIPYVSMTKVSESHINNKHLKNKHKVNKSQINIVGSHNKSDKNNCKSCCIIKHKSILISENDTVKYCLVCSSIYDTNECKYCMTRIKNENKCVCKIAKYVCDMCSVQVGGRKEMIKHLEICNVDTS